MYNKPLPGEDCIGIGDAWQAVAPGTALASVETAAKMPAFATRDAMAEEEEEATGVVLLLRRRLRDGDDFITSDVVLFFGLFFGEAPAPPRGVGAACCCFWGCCCWSCSCCCCSSSHLWNMESKAQFALDISSSDSLTLFELFRRFRFSVSVRLSRDCCCGCWSSRQYWSGLGMVCSCCWWSSGRSLTIVCISLFVSEILVIEEYCWCCCCCCWCCSCSCCCCSEVLDWVVLQFVVSFSRYDSLLYLQIELLIID